MYHFVLSISIQCVHLGTKVHAGHNVAEPRLPGILINMYLLLQMSMHPRQPCVLWGFSSSTWMWQLAGGAQLFVCFGEQHKGVACSKHRVVHWVFLIFQTYLNIRQESSSSIKCHSTCLINTCRAALKGVPLADNGKVATCISCLPSQHFKDWLLVHHTPCAWWWTWAIVFLNKVQHQKFLWGCPIRTC